MDSEILYYIGLGSLDIGYIFIGITALVIILMVLIIIQITNTSKLKKKYAKFMKGKDAKSLEKDIIGLYEDNKFMKTMAEENKEDIRILFKKSEIAFQKMGLVKYDAFRQMGGQLSFSLALLDEKDNGFIINSVHSTEGCYSYTKEIKNGQSKISLGDEEKQALNMAIGIED